MHRIWAIIERDLRRFRRSPTLMIVSMVMPLAQLLVLGYAFGGTIKNLTIGVVDHDHSVPAVKLQEMFNAVAANARTFDTTPYADETTAIQDLRNGRINAVVTIPPISPATSCAGARPRFALVVDNTDQFSASALQASLTQLVSAYNPAPPTPGLPAQVQLNVVEVYPYVPYIQFLLPGSIVLAIFVSAMIGGGIIYIDDKARGLHEGYLVTPITKLELIMGFNLSGAIKAILAGTVIVTAGSLIAGIPDPLNVFRLARMMILVVVTSLALISMMFLLMVRVSDPLVPRAIFGVLNTVLFFPSGAVYPIGAFPPGCAPSPSSIPSPTPSTASRNSSSRTPASSPSPPTWPTSPPSPSSPWPPPPSSSAAPSDHPPSWDRLSSRSSGRSEAPPSGSIAFVIRGLPDIASPIRSPPSFRPKGPQLLVAGGRETPVPRARNPQGPTGRHSSAPHNLTGRVALARPLGCHGRFRRPCFGQSR